MNYLNSGIRRRPFYVNFPRVDTKCEEARPAILVYQHPLVVTKTETESYGIFRPMENAPGGGILEVGVHIQEDLSRSHRHKNKH